MDTTPTPDIYATRDPLKGLFGVTWFFGQVVSIWQHRCTLFAFRVFEPWIDPRTRAELADDAARAISDHQEELRSAKRRDILVVAFLGLSVAATAMNLTYASGLLAAAIFGFAVYRLLDISFAFLSLGIFSFIRKRMTSLEIPAGPIRRMLVLLLINYVESVLWFACIYEGLHRIDGDSFSFPSAQWSSWMPLLASTSTVSTIGYGNVAPSNLAAVAFTFWQALVGVLALSVAIGGLLGLLSNQIERVPVRYDPDRNAAARLFMPIVVPLLFVASAMILLAMPQTTNGFADSLYFNSVSDDGTTVYLWKRTGETITYVSQASTKPAS